MHWILVRGVLFTKDCEILAAKIAYLFLLMFGVVVTTVLPSSKLYSVFQNPESDR